MNKRQLKQAWHTQAFQVLPFDSLKPFCLAETTGFNLLFVTFFLNF